MTGAGAVYDKVGEEAREHGATSRPRSQIDTGAPTMPSPRSEELAAEPPPSSLPWCVDRGDALEAMSTIALWTALEGGTLPHDIRVWREGMECWTPACQVRELRWTLSQPEPQTAAPPASGLVSVGLTPAEIGEVSQWAAASAPPPPEQPRPASSREERAEMPTLVSSPDPESDPEDAPISLVLPWSLVLAAAAAAGGEQGGAQEEGPPSTWRQGAAPSPAPALNAPPPVLNAPPPAVHAPPPVLNAPPPVVHAPVPPPPRTARVGRLRDALYIAAGCAVAAAAIGVAVLATRAPRTASAAPRPASGVQMATSIEASDVRALAQGVQAAETSGIEAPSPASKPGNSRCGERGQHRLRRGYAERPAAISAVRGESR